MGLVAPRHVGSSRTGARTRVPRIGRRILNHCTTREVLLYFYMVRSVSLFFYNLFYFSRVWKAFSLLRTAKY